MFAIIFAIMFRSICMTTLLCQLLSQRCCGRSFCFGFVRLTSLSAPWCSQDKCSHRCCSMATSIAFTNPCFISTSKLQTGARPDRPAMKANVSGDMSVHVLAFPRSGETTVHAVPRSGETPVHVPPHARCCTLESHFGTAFKHELLSLLLSAALTIAK